VTQQVSEDATGEIEAAEPATGLRVLVVEDEALIRLDLTEMLSGGGLRHRR
jgi:response regulator NasT